MTPIERHAALGPTAFPPRTPADIDAYPESDLVDGYLSYERRDPEPGPNRSPGFRWGWHNRKRDAQREDDGHDAVRHAYIAEGRMRRTWDRLQAARASRPGLKGRTGG